MTVPPLGPDQPHFQMGPVLLGQALTVHEGLGLRASPRPTGYKVMQELALRSSQRPSLRASATPTVFAVFKQGP